MAEKAKNKNLTVHSQYCFHCGLPAKSGYHSYFNEEKKLFCCNGCKTAFELINSVGATSYYKNRIGFSEEPIKNLKIDLPYDSPEFKNKYLKEVDCYYEINLHLDNLHCPSCVWVIEKVLESKNGIEYIGVNFAQRKLKLKYNFLEIALEEIIASLSKVGYPATPIEKNAITTKREATNNLFMLRLAVSAFGMVSTMFLAEPFYFDYIQDLDHISITVLQWLSLIISTPIFLYLIYPFARTTFQSLKFGKLTMDSLIFLGSTGIYLFSLRSTIINKPPIYFDCLTMFLFFILSGRYLQFIIQQKVFNDSTKTISDLPQKVTKIFSDNEEKIITLEEITIGDLILVGSGEKIPIDGEIVEGNSHVSEAIVTGESRPIKKSISDKVISGSINLEGSLYIKVEKTGDETVFSKIINLSEDLMTKKTKLQSIADRVAHYLIISVIFIAIGTYLYHYKSNPDFALLTAISILLITCPCALGLAMPAAITLGSSIGMKNGIYFKDPEAFEKISKLDQIIFDKTGTLTSGKMTIESISSELYSDNELLKLAASVERYSEHPIAWSIVSEAKNRGIETIKATDFKSFIGGGVSGVYENKTIFIGSETFLFENGVKINHPFDKDDSKKVFLGIDGKYAGCIVLNEKLRDNTQKVIDKLLMQNYSISLISGDKNNVVEKIANKLGINSFYSEVKPKDKADLVKNVKTNSGLIAMVGDGINDAPAMATSDIGIAICPNNEISKNNSDIIILNNDFSTLEKAISLSKYTYKVIQQNIFLSLTYNVIALPFAIMGYISPLWAAVIMPASSFMVILNSLKILKQGNK